MSGDFFEQLKIPKPDANLRARGGTQAEQTGAIMIHFEKHLMKNPTDFVLVVGDVTSTMVCAITAQKLQTKVAHVEAGIRSNDWLMPEEINHERLHLLDPMSYLEFNYLVEISFAVLTDSGGITEETTVMGVPCIALRDNTEKPETIHTGTNELVGTNPKNRKPYLDKLSEGNWKKGSIHNLWDSEASSRIVNHILFVF